MRIGEVAERCGLPARTIRFYERRGLLPEPDREANGYRRYEPTVIERVAFIRNARAAGLTLAETRGVLDIRDTGSVPCGHVTNLLRAKQTEVLDQIARLQILETELGALIEHSAQLDPANCESEQICHILQAVREPHQLPAAEPPEDDARAGHRSISPGSVGTGPH